jgi:hypothetical protein
MSLNFIGKVFGYMMIYAGALAVGVALQIFVWNWIYDHAEDLKGLLFYGGTWVALLGFLLLACFIETEKKAREDGSDG